jgi:DNA-binding response OmpR family regulator
MIHRKVLIIEDEIDLCLLLKGYFLRKEYEVIIAHTLNEGVELLKTTKPDILFLDNNLPDGVGWNVAPELAKQYPNMHTYLISGFHPQQPKMPKTANFKVIEKPFSLNEIDKQLAAI